MCFGARNNQFGRFYLPSRGRLAAIKLVHSYGYVSCYTGTSTNWSYWGCAGITTEVNVVITTKSNRAILPPSQFLSSSFPAGMWSRLPGYDSLSSRLVLRFFSHPLKVRRRQQLRLWYGEDLMNWTEWDNGGRSCAYVYALYV